ncbi:hypothetical protein HDF16_006398, partial [Granulicella aggregans]
MMATFDENQANLKPVIDGLIQKTQFPMSFAQQRLWLLSQIDSFSTAYHVPLSLHLAGSLDRTALALSLRRIIERHEILRTIFYIADHKPIQQVIPPDKIRFVIAEHDLRSMENSNSALSRIISDEQNLPFELSIDLPIRSSLIRLSEREWVFLVTMHHIVSDQQSVSIFSKELEVLYQAFSGSFSDPLPELPIQYVDFAAWQHTWLQSDKLKKQALFWTAELEGAPSELNLFTKPSRVDKQNYSGALTRFKLDAEVTNGLKRLSKTHEITLFTTLLSCWAILLFRCSGQEDIVIGVPTSGRGSPDVEQLIGIFINLLAIRVALTGSPTTNDFLRQVAAQSLKAQQNQDLPFEKVVALCRQPRNSAKHPLFQVLFSWTQGSISTPNLPGLHITHYDTHGNTTSKFDLSLYLHESEGMISGGIEYATALFDPATIDRYASYFQELLQAVITDDTQPVDRLAILPATERQQVLYEWNDTATEFPAATCIQELFEEQVELSPQATALV